MTIGQLLAPCGRAQARGRAARYAGRLVLLGATLLVLLLFLARAGFDVPLVTLPRVAGAENPLLRVLGFGLVSFLGLLQGAGLLALLYVAALVVRLAAPALLRPGTRRLARQVDRRLGTDRFLSAFEARGPLAFLVLGRAAGQPPPADCLRPPPERRGERWLRRLVSALVLLVALMPGTAPGSQGRAPVAGEPEGGEKPSALVLRLLGEKESFGPREPVPLQVLLEASAPPARDLVLPVRLVLDGGAERPLDRGLFLAAGAPGQDVLPFDLRPLASDLAPGEHVAVARAGLLESNAYRFRIEGPPGGGGDAAEQPPPPPEPKPDPSAPPDRGDPPDTRPRYVEPLVREGEQVRKRARVPIEVPGGGAPAERSLEEAWPELERRREEALERPGLSPTARKLVREYFERLRPEER